MRFLFNTIPRRLFIIQLSAAIDPLPQRFLALDDFPTNGLRPRYSFAPDALLFLFHSGLILRTLV
jgi:hypothetical protein